MKTTPQINKQIRFHLKEAETIKALENKSEKSFYQSNIQNQKALSLMWAISDFSLMPKKETESQQPIKINTPKIGDKIRVKTYNGSKLCVIIMITENRMYVKNNVFGLEINARMVRYNSKIWRDSNFTYNPYITQTNN